MLVLTRKLNQTITIGSPNSGEPPIEITIIEVKGDTEAGGRKCPQVRLGIVAPPGVVVDRKEIWLEKQAGKHDASRP